MYPPDSAIMKSNQARHAILDNGKALGFTWWEDGGVWLGCLDEFPDHLTQGESLVDLKVHLLSLYEDVVGGEIPHVRRRGAMEQV